MLHIQNHYTFWIVNKRYMVTKKGYPLQRVAGTMGNAHFIEYTTPMPASLKAKCQFLFDQTHQTLR